MLQSVSVYQPLAPYVKVELSSAIAAGAVGDDWEARGSESHPPRPGTGEADVAADWPSTDERAAADGAVGNSSAAATAWVVQPHGALYVHVTLSAPGASTFIDAVQGLLLRGMLPLLPVRILARVVYGKLRVAPPELRLEPTFPGRDVGEGVYMTNDYLEPVTVVQARVLNDPAGRFAVVPTGTTVAPNETAMVAIVTFRPSFDHCGHIGVSAACIDAGRFRQDQGGASQGDAGDYYDDDGGSSGARVRMVAAVRKEEEAWKKLVDEGKDRYVCGAGCCLRLRGRASLLWAAHTLSADTHASRLSAWTTFAASVPW